MYKYYLFLIKIIYILLSFVIESFRRNTLEETEILLKEKGSSYKRTYISTYMYTKSFLRKRL